MAESEGIQSWAKRVKLVPEIVTVLEENGFTTVDELSVLSPADIKEAFQDSGLLNMAQCLLLRRAVTSLHEGQQHSGPTPPPPPPPPTAAAAAPPLQYPGGWTSDPSSSSSSSSSQAPYPSQPHHPPYPHQPDNHPPYPHQPDNHPPYPPRSSQPGYPWSAAGVVTGAPCIPHPQGAQASTWGGSPGEHCAMNDMDGRGDGGAVGECFRFLLLGKTGSGKSTTGNTIFGERLFITAATFSSVTSDCERKTNTRGGRKLEILDSPGLYDTHKTQEEIGVVIVQAVAGMHPGPHAVLYVVRLGRYTVEEFAAYQRLKALFDETISRYMIVVFTHGDMLEREGQSIGDLVGPSAPESLRQVLRECNHRYVVFNNMAANPQPQVEHLLQMVRQLSRENGGHPYSCPKYSNIGQGMEEEVGRRLHEVEKRDLKRQKYVQQLEQQTKEAEESARRLHEEFQKNEEERQHQMEQDEEKRRQLEQQLQTQIREKQIGFENFQEELHRLHQEREEQAQMMKEKEAQMSEMEKKRAEEQAEQMRQREEEMQAKLAEQQERLSRQRQEDEDRLQRMEQERQEFIKQQEEQRRKEIEDLQRQNEEREKLWEKQREEEREAAKRRQENYEKEMEELKSQVAAKRATEFSAWATAIRDIVLFLAQLNTDGGPMPHSYLEQRTRRPITHGRGSYSTPHSDEDDDEV